jgi:hypothetical protein
LSEYQYYEFVAIDRPLSKDDIAELRAKSSRAEISTTSFVNEYHWGDLKGDPAQWMRRYFDAHVYVASWRSCRLMLRLPHGVFKKSELKPFLSECALTVDDAKTHWIIDWSLDESDDDDRFGMEDGHGWMGRLAPLRDELMRGDLRPLYLGWLAAVTRGEVDDDALEPPVPMGMSQLTAAQQALVEFLEIDSDLLGASAVGSEEAGEWIDDDSIDTWVAGLSRNETKIVFSLLLEGSPQQAERRVKSEFFAWQKENGATGPLPVVRRTVAELQNLANEAEERRQEQEEEEDARQEEADRQKREAMLQKMAGNVEPCWAAIKSQVERATAASYEEATRALGDLADAYALSSTRQEFDRLLRLFMVEYAKRSALVRRLVAADLLKK